MGHEEPPPDTEEPPHDTEDSAENEPATKKLVMVRNTEDAAPNLLLNIDEFSTPCELWTVALAEIVLQVGVLLYSGFITYYPTLMFRKGGLPVTDYAYPCTAIGTILLASGMLICSHVVESSTREKRHRPSNKFQARIVYLQRAGTVNDQSFGSFTIFAKGVKPVIMYHIPPGIGQDTPRSRDQDSRRHIHRPGRICDTVRWFEINAMVGNGCATRCNSYHDRFAGSRPPRPDQIRDSRKADSRL